MLIVAPDFARRIDLPGAGPCPRPVDIDRSVTGFARLVSLRVYSFAQGVAIDGEAEEDEVFIVLMRGAADIAIRGVDGPSRDFALRPDGGVRAVYLPPHGSYRLSAVADCDIAYARSTPVDGKVGAPEGFAAQDGGLAIAGHASGMTLSLSTFAAGDRDTLGEGAPERLLHIRGGSATLAGDRMQDWGSAAIAAGEAARLDAEGSLCRLLVSASP